MTVLFDLVIKIMLGTFVYGSFLETFRQLGAGCLTEIPIVIGICAGLSIEKRYKITRSAFIVFYRNLE